MKGIQVLIASLCILGAANAATWAVLVAGSNGFYNYRHQADVCHAYVSLVRGGIPAKNIIVFSYDDVAGSPQNPLKGKLVNRPNGPDVYADCKDHIDYKGKDVTPENFLSVLKQDEDAVKGKGTGRVLKSTANDKVFINFADHGASGLIAFPSSYLYRTSLEPVLHGMWKNKQYQELVFYLEACESGSMFNGWATNEKFYALTAANEKESSWGYYCPPDDRVNGTAIGSCLGDLYSINWMEDMDAQDTAKETLQEQYKIVLQKTTKSHVMQYGDLSFQSETVNNFIGNQKKQAHQTLEIESSASVESRDVKLMYLINKYASDMNDQTMDELSAEIAQRKFYDDVFGEIKGNYNLQRAETTDFKCYKNLIESFEEACGKFSEYGYKYMRVFYDICASQSSNSFEAQMIFTKKCLEAELM